MSSNRAVNGSIYLVDNELRVTFPFNKFRFESMKRISGVEYNKELKAWRVPLRHLGKLESSRHFSRKHIKYGFSEETSDKLRQEVEANAKEAIERILSNPFSVAEADLAFAEVDVIFQLAPKSSTIRAQAKARSKAKKLLESIDGVHYIRSERLFWFPTHRLTEFLKKLKAENILFAVEQRAGHKLQQAASLRRKIIANPESADSKQLEQALLGPYISLNSNNNLCFNNFTTAQLKSCFDKAKTFSVRKRHASNFPLAELNKLLQSAHKANLHVWLTREVHQLISEERKRHLAAFSDPAVNFKDEILSICLPEACWCLSPDGLAGFLVSKEYLDELSDLDFPLPLDEASNTYSCWPNYSFLQFDEDSLMEHYVASKEFFANNNLAQPPRSSGFIEHSLLNAERKKQLERRQYFQQLTDCKPGLLDRSLEEKLFPHQRVAVKWLLETKAAFLGDDMGLGKTLTVLASFRELKERGNSDFLLVVCPNSLVLNWTREVEQWCPDLMFSALPSTKSDRLAFFKQGALIDLDGLVVNYEALRLSYVYPLLAEFIGSKKTILCLDESQRAKNPNSKTFQALRNIAEECSRRVLLSGTPTPKDVTDVWAQMFLLDNGERLGANYYSWLETVADLGNKWSEYAINSFKPEGVRRTVRRVHEVLLRRKKEDVVDLPEKLFSSRDIELKGEQKKRYEEIRKDLLLRITATTGDTYLKEIDSLLEEYLRAVQVASNPRLVDPGWEGEPAKFLELDEIVKEVVREREQKLVIWTNYRENVRELTERYSELGAVPFTGDTSVKDRARFVEEFQDTKSKDVSILIAIPAAGGVGITLTAAQTAVYVDKTWNGEHWMQSIDRIHRIGQRGTVSIISLHASRIDWLIAGSLRKKTKEQATLLGDKQTQGAYLPSRSELIGAVS